MKVRQTFAFPDEEREAIARELGCRAPATRTQIVQWVAEVLGEHKMAAVTRLRRFKLNPDSNQTTFADLEQGVQP